ncbi:MAG: hypothetical protein QOG62_98 [Thermoleophilaceae bacterium]|jgi:uncharacterized membrane protein|nr:hypothetical protein [Thermoleophilaceae bacterium]
MSTLVMVLVVLAALGSALVAGVFYGFSTFIMKALGQLSPARGVDAMQQINITAPMAGLMIAMFGTAGLSIALIVVALTNLAAPHAVLVIAAGVIYLLGSPIITMTYHVPRNNRLAKLDPESEAAAEYWARYLPEWTRGNHLRALLPAAAAALYILALL